MRYTIVDLEGAVRDSFSDRADLEAALHEAEQDAPGSAAALYVLTYAGPGQRVGEAERGDEVLAAVAGRRAITGFVDTAREIAFAQVKTSTYRGNVTRVYRPFATSRRTRSGAGA